MMFSRGYQPIRKNNTPDNTPDNPMPPRGGSGVPKKYITIKIVLSTDEEDVVDSSDE